MSTKTIYINQQVITLDSSQLIQAGGEGMVFGVADTAVKLYHSPTPAHQQKLHTLLQLPLPANVFGPRALAHNAQGQAVGFQMPRLDGAALPMKQLGNPGHWQKMGLKTAEIIPLLQHAHTTLEQLHQQGIVVGDLNDCNIFYLLPPAGNALSFWLDVDSYQFAGYPCPVAQQPFLDPALFSVTDFSQRPFFTPLTDWYAYFVLLVKSLLQVHPYGGAHHSHKSLPARAAAGVSILDNSVIYPKNGRSPQTLSDDLLHHLHRFFDKGERYPLPASLLADYLHNLTPCPHCSTEFPRNRTHCPTCKQAVSIQYPVFSTQYPVSSEPYTVDSVEKVLWRGDGFIEHVAVLENGRIWAVIRVGNGYKLARLGVGGKAEEVALFNGRPGYRFAVFGSYLVVNPGNGRQLLVLDASGAQPKKVTMVETATFRDSAVFAATPHHLYRIAGTWIMRGSVQNGLFVEDPIATAHRAQTQFYASPYTDMLVGYHRVFAEQRFFVLDAHGATYDIAIPAPKPGESVAETAVFFTPSSFAISRLVGQNGRFAAHTHLCNLRGEIKQTTAETAETLTSPFHPFHIPPNDAIYHTHPSGWLAQYPTQLIYWHS